MERAKELEHEGREIRLTAKEISSVVSNVDTAISTTYEELVLSR